MNCINDNKLNVQFNVMLRAQEILSARNTTIILSHTDRANVQTNRSI